jgi:RNA polymerase sigma-70 factor (family 1)
MCSPTDDIGDIKALIGGSYDAFERLYNAYSGKLYNFIMKISSGDQYVAEEVVQTTFIRIWELHSSIDPDKKFISFLCTIAKNHLVNMYQHQMVEYIYNDYIRGKTSYDNHTEELISFDFLKEYINTLAKSLPPQRKKIFILSKQNNYTNKEIAKIMKISESTVSSQLMLAMNYIRDQLLKHYDTLITLIFAFFVNEIK